MNRNLTFPLDDIDYYGGKINFQVLKEIPPEIKFSRAQVKTAQEVQNNFDVDVQSTLSSYVNTGLANVKKTRYEYGQKASLYLPQAIQFQDGVVFDEFSLGRIGAGAEEAIKNGGGLSGGFKSAGSGISSLLTDIFNTTLTPDAARLAATRISRIGPEAAGSVRSSLQTTSNPNKRTLFREVNIREFSFTFKLIPTSKQEAEIIKDMIKFFRTELYPEDSVIIGGVPVGYRFPNKFIISFKHNQKNIGHKLLPSYLVSMQTVYNSTGMGFFNDGNFTEVDVTMNFRESRTLSKKDVDKGGY